MFYSARKMLISLWAAMVMCFAFMGELRGAPNHADDGLKDGYVLGLNMTNDIGQAITKYEWHLRYYNTYFVQGTTTIGSNAVLRIVFGFSDDGQDKNNPMHESPSDPTHPSQQGPHSVTFKLDPELPPSALTNWFHVKPGGKLVIVRSSQQADESVKFIFDGEAKWGSADTNRHVIASVSNVVGHGVNNNGNVHPGSCIYIENSQLELNHTMIQNWQTSSQGGAIHVEGKSGAPQWTNTLKKVKFKNCSGTYASVMLAGAPEASFLFEDCEIMGCFNNGLSGYGGTIRYSSGRSMEFKKCRIHNNFASEDGGFIHASPQYGDLIIHDCDLYDNASGLMGGAVFAQGKYTDIRGSRFYGNTSGRGGAIIFKTFQSDPRQQEWDTKLDLDTTTVITNNHAIGEGLKRYSYQQGGTNTFIDVGYGGGVSFYDLDSITISKLDHEMNINGALIADNTATVGGGGIDLQNDSTNKNYQVTLNLNSGVISNNVCTGPMGGGGVFVRGVDVEMGAKSEIQIVGNVATNGTGGGLSCYPSTCNDDRTTVRMSGGAIVKNIAKDGGGLYLTNCDYVATGGNVLTNLASAHGGGICLSANSTATFSNQVNFVGNMARMGGGGALNANAQATIEHGNFLDNTAYVGGGAYLIGGARLEISSGLFMGNLARTNDGSQVAFLAPNLQTATDDWIVTNNAYHMGEGHRAGFGAGIYLGCGTAGQPPTTLYCPPTDDAAKTVGVIGNLADVGGDDIVCDGTNTLLTLPTAKLTSATGYLYQWFEDYNREDVEYPNYMKVARTSDVPERYRVARPWGTQVHASNEVCATTNNYLCLTLGYAVDISPISLWITDHEDIGNGWVNLAFEPSFGYKINLPDWLARCRTNNFIKCVGGYNEGELEENEPFPVKLRERDSGTNDLAKGWVWVTVPALTNLMNQTDKLSQLWKVVIDEK